MGRLFLDEVAAGRPRFEASEERRRELGERTFSAIEGGDVEALEELLSRDVVLRGDGGVVGTLSL